MNTLVLLVGVCAVAALGLTEAEDLTSSALEQLLHHHRRQTKETEQHLQQRKRQKQILTGGQDKRRTFRQPTDTQKMLLRRQTKTENGQEQHLRRQVQCQDNPSAAVMHCFQSLEEFEHPAAGLNLDEIDTPEALNIICQAMDEATECVREVHESCGQEDLMSHTILETIEGVTGYMCQAKIRQLIVEEADCWENSEVEAELEECPTKNQPGPGGDYCGAMDGMIRCAKDAVAAHCSRRAAEFVGRLFYLAINPLASNLLDCDLQMRVARNVMNLLPMSRRK